VAYDLRAPLPEGVFRDVDAVIHAATETQRGAFPDIAMETAAFEALLTEARRDGARVVFVSSQTASPDAPTAYGRLKWRCEQAALAEGACVARLGQVYGGPEQGLWARLAAVARSAVAVPRFLPEPKVQPIHVDDAAAALVNLALGDFAPRVYAVADPVAVPFSEFLRRIAQARYAQRPIRVPIPAAAVTAVVAVLNACGVSWNAGRQLRSLLELRPMDSGADMGALGIVPHQLEVGATGRTRRMLVREGRIVLRYLLGRDPGRAAVARYVRAVETPDTRPLVWPAPVSRMPCLLAFYDQPGARARAYNDALARRIEIALLLAEGSPPNADRFLLARSRGARAKQIAGLIVLLAGDSFARIGDLVFGRLLARGRPRVS